MRVVGEAHSEVREAASGRGAGGLESPDAAVPAQARLLQFLQQSAGNRAVSGLVQPSRDRSKDAMLAPVQREGATAQRQRSENEQPQIKHAGTQPTRLQASFGHAVLQREVTRQTQIDWEANAAGLTGNRRRKEAFGAITKMINKVLWNPNPAARVLSTRELTDALQKLRADAHYVKYVGAIDAVLNDLAGDAPMSPIAVGAYVDQNQAALFPPGADDLADQEVLALRKSILISKLVEQQQTVSGVYQNAAGLAARGVQGGQWVGRGLCQEAAQAGGAHAQEITPNADRSSIDWNHYINRDGALWRDRTWKQFFNLADTAGKPPIFHGDAAAFRALGLPKADTDRYLAFLGK